MRLLTLAASNVGGGANRFAMQLHTAVAAAGHETALMVGPDGTAGRGVIALPAEWPATWWNRFWTICGRRAAGWQGRFPGAYRLPLWCQQLAVPGRLQAWLTGAEDFHFAGGWRVLQQAPWRPDLLHGHNLHRFTATSHFPLAALAQLSQQVPTVVTLHDQWLLTGHCAYTFACARWRHGCGACPHLDTVPALQRDGTAANLQRKAAWYRAARLYPVTPSAWLHDQLRHSVLVPAIAASRVIYNGVNCTTFAPGDQARARQALGLPAEALIVLCSAGGLASNMFKDFPTMLAALAVLRQSPRPRPVLLLGLGSGPHPTTVGQPDVQMVPFVADDHKLAQYYQAADLFAHAAKAENFPLVILEAMACGCPVVATAVGGIAEQIRSLPPAGWPAPAGSTAHPPADATGILVPAQEPAAMAAALAHLLARPALRQQLSANAAADARQRFDERTMLAAYLRWYEECREDFARPPPRTASGIMEADRA